MDLPRFLRLFQMRTNQVMWLFGAGTSRSAGIKTAWDMIWDFKQKLYCSQKKIPLSAITDLSDPAVQRALQAHFDGAGGFPAAGSETEYSAYFEATYPSPRDRRAYLDGMLTGAKPSFGHRALGLLFQEDLARIVWTTNFDRLVEDSAAKIFDSTGRLVVADLGEPAKLQTAFSEGRWPILGKLHGDFHSDRLKNTSEELVRQDEAMRRAFVGACRTNGLAVVGYSGRDASILAALRESIQGGNALPGGLFWFKRAGEIPFEGVTALLAEAVIAGVEAHFVEVETFDELFSDVVRFVPQTASKIEQIGDADRPRLGKALLRVSDGTFPVVRTNALPITSFPASCRLAVCTIGGVAEVQEAAKAAGVNLDLTRVRAGVLAFGRDADLRKALAKNNVTSLETFALAPRRFRYESGERSLVRDALVRSIGQRPGLVVERRGRRTILFTEPSVDVRVFNRALNQLSGVAPGTNIRWREGCELRLDWRLDQLWLLIAPCIVLDLEDGMSEDAIAKARDFVRERRAQRRNKDTNSVFDGWIELIVGKEDSRRYRAFGISDGIDADFEIQRVTAYSGRARP